MIIDTEAKYLDAIYLTNRLNSNENIRSQKISYSLRRSRSSNSIYIKFWITNRKSIKVQVRISDHKTESADMKEFVVNTNKLLTINKKHQFTDYLNSTINKLIKYNKRRI